jgi:hypothetical protein
MQKRTLSLACATAGALLMAGCGGGNPADAANEALKSECIDFFKSERPQFKGDLIAFDLWTKGNKTIVEIGTEQETGRGKNKSMVRTVVDHCIYDPETELFRLPTAFDTSWTRDGTEVQRFDPPAKTVGE